MLTLTRKAGEKVFVGEDVCVVVLSVDRHRVRLGIEAPREVAIFREEIRPAFGTPPAKPSEEDVHE